MYTAEVEDQILRKHIFGDVEVCDVLSHRIAVLVGRPVLWRFTCNAGTVTLKGILDIGIDGCAIALCLPVAWHLYLPPTTHVIVLTVEVNGPLLWITTPTKQPLSVETHNFLTLLPFRRQLQRRMVRQFVDTEHCRVLPVSRLCRSTKSKEPKAKS